MDKTTAQQAIKWIETDPCCRYVLKDAWQKFKDCDPVDAFKDVDLLREILKTRIAH